MTSTPDSGPNFWRTRRIAGPEDSTTLFVVHQPGGLRLAEGLEHLRERGLARPDLKADGYLFAR